MWSNDTACELRYCIDFGYIEDYDSYSAQVSVIAPTNKDAINLILDMYDETYQIRTIDIISHFGAYSFYVHTKKPLPEKEPLEHI